MKTCQSCGNKFTRQDSLTRHINTICDAPDSWVECNSCGNFYKDIGNHYHYNENHRPDIPTTQHEIITGVLLGDGYIKYNDSGRPRFGVSMVSIEYINYLQDILQPLSKNIYEPPIGENNVQQQYSLNTITHPELNRYKDWYSTGEKIYPKEINITPIVLKHWYVTDGHLQTGRYPSIRCWNERENISKVCKYFDDTPLDVSFSSGTIRFPNSKDAFFEYIGSATPGFEHKWP